jgi:protein-L-isoaspartate(D-aspartate) O-methyltransferase
MGAPPRCRIPIIPWTPLRAGLSLAAAALCLACLGHAAAPDYAAQRAAMVRQLRKQGIRNERLLTAMGKVPRHLFVPERYRAMAYAEAEVPIGSGEVMLCPHVVAMMTEALDPQSDAKVLEVGTGSGYLTAVLSELTTKTHTVESRPAMADAARARLRSLGYASVQHKTGDRAKGWPEKAPFAGIVVTCAVERVPQPLVDQLADGGRLVVPVGSGPEQTLTRIVKTSGRLRSDAVATVRITSTLTDRVHPRK